MQKYNVCFLHEYPSYINKKKIGGFFGVFIGFFYGFSHMEKDSHFENVYAQQIEYR